MVNPFKKNKVAPQIPLPECAPPTIQERGQLAKQLLANPVLQEAFAKIEAELTASWKVTPFERKDLREGIWLKMDALRSLQQSLNGFINIAVLEKKIKEK